MKEQPHTQASVEDTIIERLLAGEDTASIAQAFPAHTADIERYATLTKVLAQYREEKPSEEGLRRALTSLKVAAAVPSPAGIRWQRFAFIGSYQYLVPLFIIVLVASGATLISLRPNGEVINQGSTMEKVAMDDVTRTSSAPGGEETTLSSNAPTAKMLSLASTMSVPMPSDADMAAVFGAELSAGANGINVDETGSMSAVDDASVINRYDSIYDKNEF